jgi:catechol 2,3-dioxygenase-like lactoylglutathione lyase family enzyme
MSRIRRLDHVGITVADLDKASAFFVQLGLEVEGRTFLEGDFLDAVVGIPNAHTEMVVLRTPDGGAGVELATFIRPEHQPGSTAARFTELGLRSVAFEVEDLKGIVERLAEDGYGLVGGVGEYEGVWRMASVRGPEGIIVSLAERID